jgi:hypothetical protein
VAPGRTTTLYIGSARAVEIVTLPDTKSVELTLGQLLVRKFAAVLPMVIGPLISQLPPDTTEEIEDALVIVPVYEVGTLIGVGREGPV